MGTQAELDEIRELKTCINDLISVLALPAIWGAGEPSQIGGTLLDVLIGILRPDFAYLRLSGTLESGVPIEMLRTAQSNETAQPAEVGRALNSLLTSGLQPAPFLIPNPLGKGKVPIASRRLGVHGELGVLAVGSARANFPTQTEKLLVDIAANEAVIGLQNAQRLIEQRRVANELDRLVAQRTSELADREAKIRRLVEANIIGIITWNLDGRILDANEAFLRMLGYTQEDLTSGRLRWTDLTPPEWCERSERAVEELRICGTVQPFEKEYFRKDGGRVWVLIGSAKFAESADEGITFVMDITDRKNAQSALQHSEEHLRQVIDTIPQQIWSGPPDGSLDFCNAQWLSFMGLTQKEAQGEGWQRMLLPEDRERVMKAWRESVANGTPYEQEERHRRADGQYRWFLSRSVPLKDSEGRILKWYGTNTDIEDRKQAADRLRLVVDTTPAMLYSARPDGYLDFFNKRWLEYLGRSLDDISGWGWTSAIHPEDLEDLVSKWRSALATGEPYETEARVRRADGEYRWMLLRKVPLHDQAGNIVRWYGSAVDIDERRRAEEQVRHAQEDLARVTRLVAMGELTAAIAHEVNQPLTAIVTNANFCLRRLDGATSKPDELLAAITAIVNDGTRASGVISRIRGLLIKGSPDRTELDINRIIQDVTSLMRKEFTRNRVSLRTEVASDLAHVRGDPVLLQQVLINLIMNAIEATSSSTSGRREILIRSAKNQDGVLVQVQDSGPGIAPELADRIFEPFFTTKAKGIGMGLSISHSIIESHAGHLGIVPSPTGALFEFTLPADDAGVS